MTGTPDVAAIVAEKDAEIARLKGSARGLEVMRQELIRQGEKRLAAREDWKRRCREAELNYAMAEQFRLAMLDAAGLPADITVDEAEQALRAIRDAHHIPYVDEQHQGGNCADIIVGLIASRMRAEASRRDWAAEAARLQHFIETKMFPGVFADPMPPPIYPTVCACVSDDQATQLGPGFTRPVCAVHPTQESA